MPITLPLSINSFNLWVLRELNRAISIRLAK